MTYLQVDAVDKVFRHRPRLSNLIGKERTGSTQALRSVTIAGEQGKTLVLLGPNGSGKSTLLKVIAGLLSPENGSVQLGGWKVHENLAAMRRRIGMAIANERSFYPRLTARENLEFFAVLEDVTPREMSERIPRLLQETGLGFAQDTLVMKFSSGMYQKLGLARALLKDPELLLLDEPSRSLAPEGVDAFHQQLKQLRNHGTTVVLATHSFDEAIAVGDAIVVLVEGRVAARSEEHLDPKQLSALYFSTINAIRPAEGAAN
ncbi:MAG: ABC transporter ATP-binding protein [Terriglobales bacterium]